MKPLRICPDCGASLDPQEVCDCQKDDAVTRLTAELERKSEALQAQIIAGIRKDAKIRQLTAELATLKRQRPYTFRMKGD